MGGLGPGVGGMEILVIALVALLVVGPKDLPVLLRRIGKVVGKARAMADEFRSSFDEMARQSELDDLRKEVEALRSGQGMYNLGADADAAFRDIKTDLEATPGPPPTVTPVSTSVDEWPDTPPVMTPLQPGVPPETPASAKAKPRKATVEPGTATEPKPVAKPKAPGASAAKAPRKAAPRKAPARKAAP